MNGSHEPCWIEQMSLCITQTTQKAYKSVKETGRPILCNQHGNIAEHDSYGGWYLTIWDGISWNERTQLCVLRRGTLNLQRYIDEILNVHVQLYAGTIGDRFIPMDVNARPHTAHEVRQYLQRKGNERMDWPAKFPDLNPIKHVWNEPKAAMTALPVQPRSAQEWNNIPQDHQEPDWEYEKALPSCN